MTLFRMALAALIVLMAGAASAQEPSCPLGGYPDEEGKCVYGITVNVAYPPWLEESEAAQLEVGTLIDEQTSNFLMDMSSFIGAYFTGGALDISYTEYEHGAPLRSIVFMIYAYTGGAHGNTFFQSVTVDTFADRVLTLDGDIFLPGSDFVSVLQPLVVAELVAQQGEYADLDWINDGTDEAADYFAWAVNTGRLELFFAPYQVAPYAMGTFQVSIAFDDLTPVVNPMLIP